MVAELPVEVNHVDTTRTEALECARAIAARVTR
jgi:hypothetical protein